MAGRIPQSFIDELIARVDIVDVIDARVPLKKAGRNFVACCPFHNEKTPSFTVSPEKQFYHCFGCGAHGTVIGFLMEYDNMEFPEAVEELARRVGMQVPREGSGREAPAKSSRELYEILEWAANHYRRQLSRHAAAGEAVDYLKRRGLTGEIAAAFGIGYAPPGWRELIKAAPGRERQLEEVGLSIANDNGDRYDRFRDRIMFPIRDRRGRVVGFGGRILERVRAPRDVDAKGDGPKYLNSPETPLFHKGRELYGLYEARQALRELPRVVVVEGYMDVVALAQYGVRYAVATLGTSVTADHLKQLFRVTPEVVFCFDGDRAGRDAAWRGLENALPLMGEGRQVKFTFLPEGEDPDTLVRSAGKEGFEERIEQALPLSEFLFEQLGRKADLRSLDGQARLVELAKPLVAKVPQGVYRHKLEQRLAELVRMKTGDLQGLLGGRPAGSRGLGKHATGSAPRPGAGGRQAPSPVRHALGLLLQQTGLATLAGDPQRFAELAQPGVALLVEVLELLQRQPHLTSGALLEHWRGTTEGKHLLTLARRPSLLNGEEDDLETEFLGALQRLDRQRKLQRREQLSQKPFQALTEAEKRELQQLLKE